MSPDPLPSAPTRNLIGKTILVVDDHRDSRDLLASAFRVIGAHVFTADAIHEAQRQLALYQPNLIVSDLRFPDGITGYDFLVWLRAQPGRVGKVPCIAVTAYDYAVAPNTMQFDAYMRKPIDLERLCTTAATLLAEP